MVLNRVGITWFFVLPPKDPANFSSFLSIQLFFSEVFGYFSKLFQSGFEVFDDFYGEYARVGKVFRIFKAFIL